MFGLFSKRAGKPSKIIQIVSVLNKLSAQSGGVTRVAMARADTLSARDLRSLIATLDYDPIIFDSIATLRSDARLGKDVGVLNFFIYYAILSASAGQQLRIKDYYVGSSDGVLNRQSRYVGLTEFRSTEYSDVNGRVFARELVGADGHVVSFQLEVPGREVLIFGTRDDACTHWLNEVSNFGKASLLIADSSTKSGVVASVSARKARKILTLHGNHLARPYKFGSDVKPLSLGIISSSRSVDAFVLLTAAQANDVSKQFPYVKNLYVIPNSVDTSPSNSIDRSNKTFVVVSRLESVKNVAMVIRAFRIAVDIDSELRLKIWGHGSQMEALERLIVKLDLSGHAQLMGYANPVSEKFFGARASLSASVSEGFGLSILESMSCGCPVIALASNYGPIEIVKNGSNGYLVENEQQMADRITQLANDDVLFKDLASGSLKTAQSHDANSIGDQWVALVKDLTDPSWQGYKSKRSKILKNSRSSIGGNILFTSHASQTFDDFRRIEIIRVNRKRVLNGLACLIEPGVYSIKLLERDREGGVLLKFSQGKNVYQGIVPIGSIEFRLLS